METERPILDQNAFLDEFRGWSFSSFSLAKDFN